MASTAQQFESNVDFQQYALPTSFVGMSNFYDQGNTPGLAETILDVVTGGDSKQTYQNYLINKDREFELAKLNDARAYETWYDSTKYQRAVEDLKAAGLNPYLAIQSGISGSGSASVGYSSSAKSNTVDKSGKAGTLAALAVAAAKILALILA